MKALVWPIASFLVASLAPARAQSSTSQTAYTPVGRWGQASALLDSLFVVQGGKTQGSGGYTYNSAPSNNDLLVLDLSQSFATNTPPWQILTASATSSVTVAPSVAFHSISPLSETRLLLFGGDGSPSVPIQTSNDSAYTLDITGSGTSRTIQWSKVDPTWSEPMRRIYHSAESDTEGSVWILGGEKADGSSILLDELWALNSTSSTPSFQLSATPPPGSIAGASATLLSDGTLLLLGGLDPSGQLQSFEEIYSYSKQSGVWGKTLTKGESSSVTSKRDGAYPTPRRDHVAVSLPDQRIFIQGGANADLSVVYQDSWILDWSVNPPVWTLLNSTGGPGPRFGHSAVAYGRQVITSFGWAGGNSADSSVYVFDAMNMVAGSAGAGTWAGGAWTTTYTPDPLVAGQGGGQQTPNTGSSNGNGSNQGKGNGSSSSGGSKGGSTSDPSSSSSPSSTSEGTFPTPSETSKPNDGSNSDSGASLAAKAGAAIGALIGVGLVAGAGYAIYRRRQDHRNWRRSDGGGALLGGDRGGGGGGGFDDGYMLEKGAGMGEYDGYNRWGGAAAPYPRADRQHLNRKSDSSPWISGNIGHAMEGSGPAFRERLALLTRFGQRDSNQQPRFDMLADEVESAFARSTKGRSAPDLNEYEDEDEMEYVAGYNRHVKERSYGRVGQDEADESFTYGDIGRTGGRNADDYVLSPFEDPQNYRSGRRVAASGEVLSGGGINNLFGSTAAATAMMYDGVRDREYGSDDGRSEAGSYDGPSSDAHCGPSSGPSDQSHGNCSSRSGQSGVPSSGGKSYDSNNVGMVSFSDSQNQAKGRRRGLSSPAGPRASPSPLIKRSQTWWDRFMGGSFIERSASGRRLAPGPSAEEPIRDPAKPPDLSAIAESPRTDVADGVNGYDEADPFQDAYAAVVGEAPWGRTNDGVEMDEMGRRTDGGDALISSFGHGRSLSSLNSNRTATSSQLEAQLRNMDVVQRTRTGSSRRTTSTRGGNSSDGSNSVLSRNPSILRARNLETLTEGSPDLDRDVDESTPGSVVWKPHHWSSPLESQYEEEEREQLNDHSLDTVHLDSTPNPATTSMEGQGSEHDYRTELFRSGKDFKHDRSNRVSEVPSLTPATTKRARMNPLLTQPLSPQPKKKKRTDPPFRGSVKDRVKAIETQNATEETGVVPLMPSSPSAKAWSSGTGTGTSSSSNDHSGASLGACSSNATTITTLSKTSPASSVRTDRRRWDGEDKDGGGGDPFADRNERGSLRAQVSSGGKRGHERKPSVDDVFGGDLVKGLSEQKSKDSKGPTAPATAKVKTVIGLAPKPQLYVANPDRRDSSGSL
ncbi:hypothetical protein IE53DRAFT_361782 [Violaceomyces palustris]|uniref:Uncharacterized protein n=1 Tax=Violaceomyces palustris TaxID=1673888 RepID=A0ACD0NZI3_9BASI|nr:hypothetical protein IE53DRAFT_361782 [Violaceomyces palustris]